MYDFSRSHPNDKHQIPYKTDLTRQKKSLHKFKVGYIFAEWIMEF